MSVPHAEILFLPELAAVANPTGRYVRTLGAIESYHAPSGICVISHKGISWPVDVELIRSEVAVGSLYQIFGEVQAVGTKTFPSSENTPFLLKARICRNVDGMDLLLYEKTVVATRQFVQENFPDPVS